MQQYFDKTAPKTKKIDIQSYRLNLKDINYYARKIRLQLPGYVFKPVPKRAWWILVHYCIISLCVVAILFSDFWAVDLLFSLIMGHSLGALFFIGHEITHGAVFKSKKNIIFFSNLCYAQWGLYGVAWIQAHNRMHHQHTQSSFKDPDCWGQRKYRYNKILRTIEKLLPGSRNPLSYLFLFWFFSFYSFYIVFINKKVFVNKKEKTQSKLFFIVIYALWIPLSIWAQPFGFFYLFLLPAALSNFVVMSYIATNHFLSPLTEEVNDPLANSLSVKTNKIFNFFHLNFSYHIEHHVFPYMSPKYAPMVSEMLKKQFGDKYKILPHGAAIKKLYQYPKFYYNDLMLINPSTKEVFPTIIMDDFF